MRLAPTFIDAVDNLYYFLKVKQKCKNFNVTSLSDQDLVSYLFHFPGSVSEVSADSKHFRSLYR